MRYSLGSFDLVITLIFSKWVKLLNFFRKPVARIWGSREKSEVLLSSSLLCPATWDHRRWPLLSTQCPVFRRAHNRTTFNRYITGIDARVPHARCWNYTKWDYVDVCDRMSCARRRVLPPAPLDKPSQDVRTIPLSYVLYDEHYHQRTSGCPQN